MDEKTTLSIEKKKWTDSGNSVAQTERSNPSQFTASPIERILFLQRTIGNRAVESMIRSGTLQTKLKIGEPGDEYEKEADRVAEQVMRMPEPHVSTDNFQIRRACLKCEENDLKRQTIKEEEEEDKLHRKPIEEEEKLQAKTASNLNPEVDPGIENHIRSMKGGGSPLSEQERAFFEPRFGADFSQVRVHTDTKASETAQALNARAFTIGNHMVFGKGQYEPDHKSGKTLIAHELTHVMQQGKGVSFKQFPFLNTNDLQRMDKFHIQSKGKTTVLQRSIINVTLPDGKMIKVDCETPPPPAPGLAPAACEIKDLKSPKGPQKKACENALNAARADSNVQKIIKNLKSLKGCSVPTMDCKDCTAGCNGAGAWHFPNAIHICADTNPSESQTISYLKHELTHELQDCRHSADVNCNDRMKMEIEAYKAAGRSFESSFQGAVWSSCITMRCKDSDINKGLAAAMKKYYDSI